MKLIGIGLVLIFIEYVVKVDAEPQDTTCPTGLVFKNCTSLWECAPRCSGPKIPKICQTSMQCSNRCSCPDDAPNVVKWTKNIGKKTKCVSTCPGTHQCPTGMVWSDCASICPATCAHPSGPTCNACKAGCECEPGTVLTDDSADVCVAPDKCPTQNPTPAPTGTCPTGMIWSNCASICPATCAHPNGPTCQACAAGCECEPGTILTTKTSDVCVTKSKCPKG